MFLEFLINVLLISMANFICTVIFVSSATIPLKKQQHCSPMITVKSFQLLRSLDLQPDDLKWLGQSWDEWETKIFVTNDLKIIKIVKWIKILKYMSQNGTQKM